MRPTAYRIFLIIFSTSLMAGGCGAAEQTLKSEDLPNAVTEVLKVRFPDLKITNAAKETNSVGETVYDVELKSKKRKFKTDIKEDGTMLEVEKEVSAKHWIPAPQLYRSSEVSFCESQRGYGSMQSKRQGRDSRPS